MTFEFKIEGGKELDAALKKFSFDVERKIAKSAVRAGANVITKEARLLAPKESGTLKKSIQTVSRSNKVGDAVASVVTRSGKKYNSKGLNAWYAPLIEFGTKYRPATPFMRPALDSKGAEAVREMAKKIQERIAKFASQ